MLYATATFEFAVQRVLDSWIRSVRLAHLGLVKNVLLYDTPIEEGSLVVKKKKRTAQVGILPDIWWCCGLITDFDSGLSMEGGRT